jgi:hypothetical protein
MRKRRFSRHPILPFQVTIKAEATPNTEMTLIVDVDMNLLKELHEHGSVNTMKDRRHDLYNFNQTKIMKSCLVRRNYNEDKSFVDGCRNAYNNKNNKDSTNFINTINTSCKKLSHHSS